MIVTINYEIDVNWPILWQSLALLDVHLVSYGIQPKRLELSDQVIYFVGGPPHLMHLEFILQTLIHVCQINNWRVGPTHRRVFKRIYITSTKNYLVLANHSCQKHLEVGSIIFKNSYHTLVERHPQILSSTFFWVEPNPCSQVVSINDLGNIRSGVDEASLSLLALKMTI